jgi:uncharacterized protein (DUF433 family)
MTEQIVSDPGIRSGTPVLVGTRIPAAIIAPLVAEGLTLEEIRKWYPSVTAEHIARIAAKPAEVSR